MCPFKQTMFLILLQRHAARRSLNKTALCSITQKPWQQETTEPHNFIMAKTTRKQQTTATCHNITVCLFTMGSDASHFEKEKSPLNPHVK